MKSLSLASRDNLSVFKSNIQILSDQYIGRSDISMNDVQFVDLGKSLLHVICSLLAQIVR